MQTFNDVDLKSLYKPPKDSSGEDNGQITIIGGSKLFHGAPLLSLSVASRFVDMVFFSSPDCELKNVVKLKSSLSSFVWIDFQNLDEYIVKSDVVLIGPGLMRYSKIENDDTYQKTRNLVKTLIQKYSDKKWVIDAGALQTMDSGWIPKNAILTPNVKEYEMLFGKSKPLEMVQKHECFIVVKAPITKIYGPNQSVEIKGGNEGLTKGGTGDVLAGLTAALYAKNDGFLASAAASHILKSTADRLYQKVGIAYSADDLSLQIPEIYKELVG